EKGEQVGVLRDPYGKTLARLKAPATGMLIGKLQHPLVNRGDAILHVAALE
ncbi:MAG: succinylglutamate desuccinylase, partial [Actinobacteria bacterium]|nr:succinylglutamate desuccinylase [Actinomycetota bacterium]